ncbi:MAG: calcium:proton antiporter, partial [Pseudomonadota bacterium]|nr:calcium:proton antiporter [Pseudomonadota bacterium]
KAAAANRLQRSVNISLGSAVSTIGLTVPVVLLVSAAKGHTLELGLDGTELVLLVLTLMVCQMTFSRARTNVLLGLIHLVIFAAFLVLVFDP